MTDALKIFKDINAIITDTHVVYASGKHGNAYVNKDAVYPHTEKISALCRMIAEKFKGKGVEVVAAPTIGGVILSQWVAHFLSKFDKREVLGVFSEEKIDGGEKTRFFKRGYNKLIPGKKVLVVEDILTTGGSVKKVIDAVKGLGGDVVACAALVNREKVSGEMLGAKLTSLIEINLDAWDEKDCPLCKKNVPVNIEVGKGREWLAKKS